MNSGAADERFFGNCCPDRDSEERVDIVKYKRIFYVITGNRVFP
jgi:hypothetical protein